MKKTLTLIIVSISLMTMSSCFLFKPVQKTCPAYSQEKFESNNSNLNYAKLSAPSNENFSN